MAFWEPDGFHQLGEGDYEGISAREVLGRMQEATGTMSQKNLAAWLEVPQSQLSDVHRRSIMPIRWMRQLILKQVDYNPVWILTGRGEKLW